MNTVPTLCAFSTIGAAAVGLSFAQTTDNISTIEQHDSFKRPDAPRQSFALQDPSTPEPARISPLPTHSQHLQKQRSKTGVRQRPTSHGVAEPTQDEHLLRPRYSFGLASTVFSLDSSNSGSRPLSRSFTYSSNSDTPLFGSSPPPLGPNKLVKRSLSQGFPAARASPSAVVTSPVPTLKRPATSHQRSATLSRQIEEGESHEHRLEPKLSQSFDQHYHSDSRPTSVTPAKRSLRHFFGAAVFNDGVKTPQKRLKRRDSQIIKRIRPDGSGPTLVPAIVVAPSSPKSDLATFHDYNYQASSRHRKRPATAAAVAELSYSSPGPASQPFDTADESSPTPRRSFSLQNFWQHTTPPSVRRTLARPASSSSKLRKLASRRATSERMYPVGQPGEENSSSNASPSPVPHRPVSSQFVSSSSRPSRHSTANSELTSSQTESDSGSRVFSWGATEHDTDARSDTVYDSVRTGTSRSTHVYNRPALETLFDKSSTSVGDFDSPRSGDGKESIDDIVSTPRRVVDAMLSSPPPPSSVDQFSPSAMFRSDSARVYGHGHGLDEMEDIDWGDNTDGSSASNSYSTPTRQRQLLDSSPPVGENAAQKANPFDWSEEPPMERTKDGSASPQRPKTQYGRGQRRAEAAAANRRDGRRQQPGLHARSRSVPLLPNLNSKSSNLNKFGTWGIGSKGVAEDWNDDFDFGGGGGDAAVVANAKSSPPQLSPAHSISISSSLTVVVPSNIREQQSNVLANIGLLREWGILIEELKELRMRAVSLGLPGGDEFSQIFQEVEAMIELADQEQEVDSKNGSVIALGGSGKSTHGLNGDEDDDDDGEEDFDAAWDRAIAHEVDVIASNTPRGGSSRKSSGASPSSADQAWPSISSIPSSTSTATTPQVRRSRKNSEAVARSVIEAIQQRQNSTEQRSAEPQNHAMPRKRVPFDTSTLRHIVPYVNNLKRRVKKALRETEGLSGVATSPGRYVSAGVGTSASSPAQSSPAERADGLLSQAFVEPDSPSRTRVCTYGFIEEVDEDREVVAGLRMMTVA